MIQLAELTKAFGDRVLLDRVTWQISDGDRVGLCGPNGAGKTTLLKMHDIEHKLADASVPQAEHDAMLERYSHLQDRFRLGDGYSMDLRIATVLRGLGFTQDDVNRPSETFSGGWQMRIALAKLLLG